jgi:hypothetical protein
MESSLRGHAADFQNQQQIQMQNQQYQQQQEQQQQQQQQYQQQQQQRYRQRSGYPSNNNSIGGSQAQDHMSVGSHFSRESRTSAASGASSQVDEAYRRLGRRLSIRAHGDGPVRQPLRLSRIGLPQSSNFAAYGDMDTSKRSSDDPQDGSSVSDVTFEDIEGNYFRFACFLISTFFSLFLGQQDWILFIGSNSKGSKNGIFGPRRPPSPQDSVPKG